jgi:hypothetical protein
MSFAAARGLSRAGSGKRPAAWTETRRVSTTNPTVAKIFDRPIVVVILNSRGGGDAAADIGKTLRPMRKFLIASRLLTLGAIVIILRRHLAGRGVKPIIHD